MKASRASRILLLTSLGLALIIGLAGWWLGWPLRSDRSGGSPPAESQPATAPGSRPPANVSHAVATNEISAAQTATPRPAQSELTGSNFADRGSEAAWQAREPESLTIEVAAADVQAAIALLRGPRLTELSEQSRLQLVHRWATNDPAAAAGWAGQIPPGTSREGALNAVAAAWANHDFAGAIEWARQLPRESERESGLIQIAYETARTDPMQALTLAAELPATPARNDLVSHTSAQWASIDPESATEWAKQVTDDPLRQRLLSDMIPAWGESDPGAAATEAIQSLKPGREQNDAVVGVVQRWVQREPEEAATWVAAFPEGPLRDTAMEEVVKLWADGNAEQAGHWLNTLEAGPVRDVGVAAYVNKVLLTAPETAAQWAKVIAGETLRLQALEHVGESWLASDPKAAQAWIAQSSLPDAVKARLLPPNR